MRSGRFVLPVRRNLFNSETSQPLGMQSADRFFEELIVLQLLVDGIDVLTPDRWKHFVEHLDRCSHDWLLPES